MLKAAVVIDYQNVHLTAHDIFNPRGGRHESLIDPMLFAQTAIRQRNRTQRAGFPEAELTRVVAYRGLPHIDHQWEQHRRCIDQAEQWRASGAEVELRDLKYSYQRGADGQPIMDVFGKKVPVVGSRPVEKGIDVLCALACVRMAAQPGVDVVVLASRDTDLVPVLDEVFEFHQSNPTVFAAIETVSWFNKNAHREGAKMAGGSLKPTPPYRIWNTNLDRTCYDASLDRREY